MTASEVVMKRDDDKIAWGFRLTGGSDLGSPFYVVKVLGRGHAERAGLRVGDLVYAINHKYINNFTHKDAQNAILHTGDTLILNIKRGPHGGRGTPLPEYADPLMGLAPIEPTPRPTPVPLPPYEPPPPVVRAPTPPDSEDEEWPEDTVAAFTVKINPKGRIAAIEELPVTPPPSPSSRCRSRSRSASAPRERRSSARREVMTQQAPENTFRPLENGFGLGGVHGPGGVQGPGEAFTYSKEVLTQYTKVFSASDQSEGQASEMINESFVIHGGSEHKMEDILSPEDIERDIFEEKMEDQKITELLTGEAEVLDQGIVGINFQKIIPKTNFIKDSHIFKELQEERIKKVESEEEQLRKDPNKRFSTFLQTPKRPVPKPKQKPPPVEELPWKKQLASTDLETETAQSQQNTQNMQTVQQVQQEETITTSTAWTESVNIVEESTQFHEERRVFEQGYLAVSEEGGPIITEAVSTESVFEERVHFEDEPGNKTEDCSIQECKEETGGEQQKSEARNLAEESAEYKSETTSVTEQTVEYKSEFEQQLAEIQKQIRSIQELPSVLQANLTALQEQLTRIVEAKAAADQTQVDESEAKSRRGSSKSQLSWKIDVDVEETKEEVCIKESEDVENQYTEQDGSNKENIEPPSEHAEEREEADTVEDLEHNKFIQNEQYENMKNIRLQKRDDDELSVTKPPMIRNFPRNVAERPIVLPGGRRWYTPRDAYNEDFIAETIINQSEVLVGSTIGLNFRKYEPPKFDAANSAVFRMIHEIEDKCKSLPIEGRPEKVLAEGDYCAPISKRHFFAARLSEHNNEHVEKILQDTNENDIIPV